MCPQLVKGLYPQPAVVIIGQVLLQLKRQTVFTIYEYITTMITQIKQLPAGLVAQFAEHCTDIVAVIGS